MASKDITIQFVPPLQFTGYNLTRYSKDQSINLPQTFVDAMSVREEVFVKGQNVPLSLEADTDDPRSCCWVAYAAPPLDPTSAPIPAGVVRMVPFPQQPHPLDGADLDTPEEAESRVADGEALESSIPPWIVDRATALHDGKEPYVKIGRLAVLESFRGRKIADALVKAALQWARENPHFFDPNGPVTGLEGEVLDEQRTKWKGLILAHAQERVAKVWAKWGFVVDEGMGKWKEADITHVGMFLRLDFSVSK